jgi:hypothetical protein
MNKPKFSRYNDGVVSIYREKDRKTDFSAKQNPTSVNDMDFVVRLAYGEAAKRESDLDFAEQRGFSLTLKVRTRNVPGVDNKCKAVIDGYLYDIAYTDGNREELWLYLEGVRALDS